MSDRKDQQNNEYKLEDILAEFGSGQPRKEPPKVVEFPQPEEPFNEDPPVIRPTPKPEPEPPKKETPKKDREPMDEIVPETVGRNLAARLATLLRRADHYADHMYDRAEPDEATRKAEMYIPGTDREELPEEEPRPRRKLRRPVEAPPDTAPADLAAKYRKGLKSRRVRVWLSVLVTVLTLAATLDLPFFSWETDLAFLPLPTAMVRPAVLAVLTLAAGLLAPEIPLRGFRQLGRLRPRAETLLALAWLFTLADGIVLIFLPYRPGLSFAAVNAPAMLFALWGDYFHRRGDFLSAKTAAQTRTPYTVTLDENKWSGRPAYSKWSGSAVGFGSQLQQEDCTGRAYRIAAPLLLLGCLLAAVMASFGQGQPLRFLWAASACFSAASTWTVLLVYGLPYRKLASRLAKQGAAMAGWPGISRCRQAGILMSDLDLFPPGSVRVAQVQIYGGVSTEKAVAYTASLLRAFPCGLTRPFHDLLKAQGAFYREVSGLMPHEGGLSAVIRNQEVLVGSAAFMHMTDVDLPQGINIKNAVYCAINGQLAGMFPLQYTMSAAVNPALSALMRENVDPILATRDFNLIPALLGQKFKLPVSRMEFPPVERRRELSEPEQEHDATPVALLCREGLSVYSEAVAGGVRLRAAARRSLTLTLIGAAVGLCLTFYLTFVGAFASLTPVNFLLFMALWLIPELLIANSVNQY